jgi:signal transduction histidine kinase
MALPLPTSPAGPHDAVAPISPRGAVAVAALGTALAASTVLVSYTGNDPHRLGDALLRGAAVLVPVAVGLGIWNRSPERRFGRLLVGAAAVTWLASLGGSDQELVYSIGRVATWVAELVLIALILAFPTGRLTRPVDRLLVAAMAGVVIVLFLPTALLVDAYPTPATWTACVNGCPGNAFQVVGHQPAWVAGVVQPAREVMASIVMLAVVLRLATRIGAATVPLRRTLTPVLAGAILHALALPIGFAARGQDPGTTLTLASTWVLAAGLPIVALGFLVGAARWRMVIGEHMYRLAGELHGRPNPLALRRLLAAALEDPRLELLVRGADGGWADAEGRPVAEAHGAGGQARTVLTEGDRVVAVLVHDRALVEQQAFVDAVGSLAAVVLANHALTGQVQASLSEVHRSRERLLAVADDERRRIERDLHDGAQQHLIALRVKLERASRESARDRLPDAEQLHQLSVDVDEAIDQMRALAAGVYPALLAARGLRPALESAARRAVVPVTVSAPDIGRLPAAIESAVYFSCLEALQNAAKHADARLVSVAVADGDVVRFEVCDDGRGFDAAGGGGQGLVNMRDRVSAVGGELVVESRPGHGTRIAGRIPHDAGAAPDPSSL